jgi:selenide,water dikinase
MLGPLLHSGDSRVLVGPDTSDDAGVFLHGDHALVATADFITPVCDDARRFGRIAAVNSLSDVWAMGGRPLFALNLCCFPADLPEGVAADILAGAAAALADAGAALLGGHSVKDQELKFGMAVVGEADPAHLLANSGGRSGDRLLLTKPLGTGVLVYAYKFDRCSAADLEPALVEMERSNAEASREALAHGSRCATDVTGFGLLGHAWNIARASRVGVRIEHAAVPSYEPFLRLAAAGVSTGCTKPNRRSVEEHLTWRTRLAPEQEALLFDPQTSGGLLIAVPARRADALLAVLRGSGHRAAAIGELVDGPPRLEVV